MKSLSNNIRIGTRDSITLFLGSKHYQSNIYLSLLEGNVVDIILFIGQKKKETPSRVITSNFTNIYNIIK